MRLAGRAWFTCARPQYASSGPPPIGRDRLWSVRVRAVRRCIPAPVERVSPELVRGLLATLADRIAVEPFNAVATGIFVLAILHTFAAARFTALAHRLQHRHEEQARAAGVPPTPSVAAELLHFLGEIEVVFGLWAIVLVVALRGTQGWRRPRTTSTTRVVYTEPLFVVVIMALASTRPIVGPPESALRRVAALGGGTPAAWWVAILTIGPLLGSFITEPAAMTICALLLARQFYDLEPSLRLKYATLGLLFVNVSIGGTLTHFAAPPVLMVARPWGWDAAFMLSHFGWRAVLGVVLSTGLYFLAVPARPRGARRRVPAVPDESLRTKTCRRDRQRCSRCRPGSRRVHVCS